MTIMYLLRVFNKVFLGAPDGLSRRRKARRSWWAAWRLLGLMSLVSGVLISPSSPFAYMAARQMLGVV